jgi:cation transport protein ChaC
MALTRADLENDVLRKNYARSGRGLPLVSEAEFLASFEHALEPLRHGAEPWIFGYGSLIWNPLFRYAERLPAVVHGFHRSFCLWSRMGRGTPEKSGLVLGLDRGGCCHGVAFRLDPDEARHELALLWRREMVLGSYTPRWLQVTINGSGGREVKALAFVVNRHHPHYAGRLPLTALVETIATARGAFGSSAEYLFQTVDCLIAQGICDSRLARLREQVLAYRPPQPLLADCPETAVP